MNTSRTDSPTARAMRIFIYTHFLEVGHAPSIVRLCETFELPRNGVLSHLAALADARVIILSPNGDRITVAPPFSHMPTPFWIDAGRRGFWGNCAWEALGVAAFLDSDATITTTCGAEGYPLSIEIKSGRVTGEGVIHISRPRPDWWDDVALTCGTILAFRSTDHVDRWCERHGFPRGETWTLDQGWEMARTWFTGRLDPAWRRLTLDEERESFESVGCTSEFWHHTHRDSA